MKRILTLSLVGAIMLGLLGVGVVSAHGSGQGDQGHGYQQSYYYGYYGSYHGYHYGIWVPCTQTTPVSGLAIYATATAAVPASTLKVTVAAKHGDPSATFTVPTASAAISGVALAQPAPPVIKHAVANFGFAVPSTATAGQTVNLSISGSYSATSGSTTFTCVLNVPVMSGYYRGYHYGIWVPCKQTTTLSGLTIYASATAAVPNSTLAVTVAVKHGDPSAVLGFSPTPSATIPGVGAVAPTSTFISHAVANFGFPVASTATVGQKATVSISGSYSATSGSTMFTCALNVPVVSATQQKGHHGDANKNGDEQGENEQD